MITRLLKILPVALLVLSGCSKDGCNNKLAFNYDPNGTSEENCVWQPLSFEVEFHPVFGDQDLNLSEAKEFTTADGRSLTIDHYGFYFTEFALKMGDEVKFFRNQTEDCLNVTSDVLLFLDTNRTFASNVLPSTNGSSINELIFNVGVDSCRNDSLDPTTQMSGPFAPQIPTMYWSWASGYRFISINGMVDASANADGSELKQFEYHIGLNQYLRTLNLPLENLEPAGNALLITVKVDFEKIFEGLDFTTDLSTHTSDNLPLADLVTENVVNAISIE